MKAYLAFLLVGLGTYGTRSAFILAVGERVLPPAVEKALRNVGAAVLAALATSLLTSDGVRDYLTDLPEVAATIVGIAAAWRWRRFLVSFVAALATLWLLRWLG